MPDLTVSNPIDTFMQSEGVNGMHAALAPVEMTRQERMTASVSAGAIVKITDEGGRIEQYLGSRPDCGGLVISGGTADGVALTRTDYVNEDRPVWASHPHNLYLGNAVGAGEARLSWDGTNWQLETSGGTVAGNTEDHPSDDGGEFDGGAVTVAEAAVAGDQNWRVVFNSAYVLVTNLSPYGFTPTCALNSEENSLGSIPNLGSYLEVGWINEADVLLNPGSYHVDGYSDLASYHKLYSIREAGMPTHRYFFDEKDNTVDLTPRLEHLWNFLSRPRPVVKVDITLFSYTP